MYNDEIGFIKSLTITFSIFLISLFCFYFLWKLIDRKLKLWSQKTVSKLDDDIVTAMHSPSKLLLVGLSMGLSLQLAPIRGALQLPLITLSKILIIIPLLWATERLLKIFILSKTLPAALSESSQTLFRTLTKVLVYSIGFLIILDTLGVSITPLLASLGVGSVAIALAAQETLSNLFSGFYILLDKPFRVGDCIKIDDGVEGIVSKIGWRSTHIKLYANNVAVLPNSKIASSMITNFDFPESDVSISIPASTSYEADLKHVEQVVLEVAFLVQNTLPIASKHLAPSMIFTSFGDSAINFSVALRVQRITDAAAMKHEFIKALHSRFQQEGLSMPYPHRVVQMIPPLPPQL